MALAGRLRHRVTIERKTEGAENAYGVPTETWATLATVNGWYQPEARQEDPEDGSGGAVGERGKVFLMPTDITEADRIVYGGDTYAIEQVHDPAGKGQHLEVFVRHSEVV